MTFRSKLVFIIFLSIFSGCINLEVETFIGADGSGSAIIHYWTDIELIYQDTSHSNIFSFSQDVIKKNFVGDGIKIKSIKVWQNQKDTTYHSEIKIVFDDINLLSTAQFFENFEFKFKDGAIGQKIFEQKIKGSKFLIENQDKYSFKFIYHFPGQIITDNANQKINSTLIWVFNLKQLNSDKTLTATIKIPTSSYYQIIIPILIVILLLLWVLLIIKRRKSRED